MLDSCVHRCLVCIIIFLYNISRSIGFYFDAGRYPFLSLTLIRPPVAINIKYQHRLYILPESVPTNRIACVSIRLDDDFTVEMQPEYQFSVIHFVFKLNDSCGEYHAHGPCVLNAQKFNWTQRNKKPWTKAVRRSRCCVLASCAPYSICPLKLKL